MQLEDLIKYYHNKIIKTRARKRRIQKMLIRMSEGHIVTFKLKYILMKTGPQGLLPTPSRSKYVKQLYYPFDFYIY